eukprot:jgi/Undpi1/13616/HiC_scaffold_9.g03270.m1
MCNGFLVFRKPASVVPEHKKRATVVWGILLLAIAGYTAWQIALLVRKVDNPSTSFTVSDDLYEFPHLDVCVWHGYGCGKDRNESECFQHAFSTVKDPCFNEDTDANTPSQVSVKLVCFFAEIVAFKTSSRPYILKGGVSRHLDTIGKSIRNYIGGESNTSYPVLSILTYEHVDQDPYVSTTSDNDSFAIGHLDLRLTQGGYSLTELTDIDPLDVGGLLGNIGGFWELLLVTWGLCFIAATSESPTHRGRDFVQPIKKGHEIVSRKRRRSATRTTSPDSEGGAEEQPYWITSRRNARDVNGRSSRVIPSVGARPPAVVAASSFRRPIQQDYPTRLASNSTRSLVTGKSFMASGGEGSVIAQDEPPAYADYA